MPEKQPLRPLRPITTVLRLCVKCGTDRPTSGGPECAECGTDRPTLGPECKSLVADSVKVRNAVSHVKVDAEPLWASRLLRGERLRM